MKTTNLEISKKLKKIGFEAETFFFWTKAPKLTELDKDRYVIALANKADFSEEEQMYPAYHLETLIEALPSVIEREGSGNNIYFKMNKNRVWYENSCNCDSSEYCPVNIYYRIDRQKNESLADTAGKMLIKLFEAGIINFKK